MSSYLSVPSLGSIMFALFFRNRKLVVASSFWLVRCWERNVLPANMPLLADMIFIDALCTFAIR